MSLPCLFLVLPKGKEKNLISSLTRRERRWKEKEGAADDDLSISGRRDVKIVCRLGQRTVRKRRARIPLILISVGAKEGG